MSDDIKVSQLPTATNINVSDEVVLNNGGITSKALLSEVLQDTGVTPHIQNANIHAPIDDLSISPTKVWSSEQVVEYINTLLGGGGAGPLPVQFGGTGLPVVDAGKMLYTQAANNFQAVGLANTLQVSNGLLDINIEELRALLGGTNIGFQPAALSSPLVLWLDAGNGITQESGSVSRWKNLAPTGEGYDAVQSDPSKQPGYSATEGPNGYPGVTFDGSLNHFLELQGAGLNIAKNLAGLTFCVVMNPDYPVNGVDDPATVLHISQSGSTDLRFNYTINNNPEGQRVSQFIAQDGGTYVGLFKDEVPTEAACWDVVTADFSNDRCSMYSDGLELNDPSLLTSSGNTSNTASQVVVIGSLPNGSYVFKGAISEILVWQGVLTAAERNALNQYLNTKYFNFNGQNVDYIVYAGDSNVFGLGLVDDEDRVHNQVEGLLAPISGIAYHSINWGLGGLEASDSLGYYESTYKLSNVFLPNARKKYLVYGIGGNDVFAGASTASILQNMRMFVDFYKNAGFIVLPWTTLPLDVAFNTQVSALAQAMRDNAVAYGWAGLIEANDAVLDPPSADFQVDNTHLTAAGVGKVAAEVVDTLEGLPGYPYL